LFFTSVDSFDWDRLRPRRGNRHRFESITFKLDKFTQMQVRAKVNPDAKYSTPLKHRSSISGCPRT
jgi:hypothetical protein